MRRGSCQTDGGRARWANWKTSATEHPLDVCGPQYGNVEPMVERVVPDIPLVRDGARWTAERHRSDRFASVSHLAASLGEVRQEDSAQKQADPGGGPLSFKESDDRHDPEDQRHTRGEAAETSEVGSCDRGRTI